MKETRRLIEFLDKIIKRPALGFTDKGKSHLRLIREGLMELGRYREGLNKANDELVEKCMDISMVEPTAYKKECAFRKLLQSRTNT